ncbi:2-oxoglutarate dehydrogenase E2 component [Buchnera aphidicola (Cinara tujafilina)]|uniref:Dihydrolipoyllysine-residue succinyltransferase n=1 Tax=Buchnera aphidicola (Cinara tujafilina) TaxID=261317 RepID=F7WZB9_9GAMM|nr:dihydrolipoyllysine-residue succinyltransferase [Buchnera aphidicola]AEH39780.1 2-oxoglutarate dehydrogenase E2 component [Buchnera aphidicola (Cinara tujafilina)]
MTDTKVLVPELPESISNAIVLKWHKNIGDVVKEDDLIAEIETDKIILEISSPTSGVIKSQFYKIGESVKSKDILASISHKISLKKEKVHKINGIINNNRKNNKNEIKNNNNENLKSFTPAIRRMLLNKTIDIKNIKINKINNQFISDNIIKNNNKIEKNKKDHRSITRIKINTLQKKISEKLLYTMQNTAMLTTFNEINMQEVIRIRTKHKEAFFKKYDVHLGFMSFFIRAATQALMMFPDINASIDNNEVIYHDYYDINVAIATKRGLIAPILLNTNLMDMFEIEKKIKYYADLGTTGKLSLNDLNSGTFTITNGGVFGSLMSTPIINPPQVAILGIHNIKNRPIVDDNIIKSCPMMYIALSYDHRLIDGKTAIKFLKYIKDILEDSSRMILKI